MDVWGCHDGVVRIVVWNMAKAANGKVDAVLSLGPDLAVLPECSESLPTLLARRPDVSIAWCGADASCGLGMIGFGGVVVRRLGPRTPDLVWAMPVEIGGAADLNLLAVWADNDRRRLLDVEGSVPLGPVRRALRDHKAMLRNSAVVVAGDFNNNSRYDRTSAPLTTA